MLFLDRNSRISRLLPLVVLMFQQQTRISSFSSLVSRHRSLRGRNLFLPTGAVCVYVSSCLQCFISATFSCAHRKERSKSIVSSTVASRISKCLLSNSLLRYPFRWIEKQLKSFIGTPFRTHTDINSLTPRTRTAPNTFTVFAALEGAPLLSWASINVGSWGQTCPCGGFYPLTGFLVVPLSPFRGIDFCSGILRASAFASRSRGSHRWWILAVSGAWGSWLLCKVKNYPSSVGVSPAFLWAFV